MSDRRVVETASTRRELLVGGAMATATVLLAEPAALAAGARDEDAAILQRLLEVEQLLVAGYESALASGLLNENEHGVLRTFLSHERAHADKLDLALAAAGVPRPVRAARSSVTAQDPTGRHERGTHDPSQIRTAVGYLRHLRDLEQLAARRYRYAIGGLSSPELLSIAAETMANEAQHATMLNVILNPSHPARSVPGAFVAGQH